MRTNHLIRRIAAAIILIALCIYGIRFGYNILALHRLPPLTERIFKFFWDLSGYLTSDEFLKAILDRFS